MMDGDAETIREVFGRLHDASGLPENRALKGILDAAREALDNEDPAIRPRDNSGLPGGLLLLNPDIPTIVVPDLHARTGYMKALIDMDIHGQPLLEMLLSGQLQVVCVGDGFHSEARGAARWKKAWKEYQGGFRRHQAMDEEMTESLGLMAMVMILKAAMPSHFHFLKGNHENVANSEEGGNRPFGKYAWEGQMVRDWFIAFLGDSTLEEWAEFETSLPLLAVGDHFLISHAEPRRFHGRSELINYRDDEDLVFDFTWTGNGEADEESVDEMLTAYLGMDEEGALYFGGHRPIRGLYGLRAAGRYVQIHNPDEYIVAVLECGRIPDPDRDIQIIESKEAR